MEPFLIDTREQYDLCKAHGIEPLIDRRFTMEIRLRVSIQRGPATPRPKTKGFIVGVGTITRIFVRKRCALCVNIRPRMCRTS